MPAIAAGKDSQHSFYGGHLSRSSLYETCRGCDSPCSCIGPCAAAANNTGLESDLARKIADTMSQASKFNLDAAARAFYNGANSEHIPHISIALPCTAVCAQPRSFIYQTQPHISSGRHACSTRCRTSQAVAHSHWPGAELADGHEESCHMHSRIAAHIPSAHHLHIRMKHVMLLQEEGHQRTPWL